MAALKDIQNKIAGVKKTRQITRAMNMVATARLRQVQGKTEGFRPYADKYAEVLGSLAGGVDPEIHPLLANPEKVEKIAVVCLSADRGLCGSFNMNLITTAMKFIKEKKSEGIEVQLFTVGRKASDFFKRRTDQYNLVKTLPGVMNVVEFDLAVQVGRMGLEPFLSGEVQEVYFVYSRFQSMARLVPTVERLVPIRPEGAAGDEVGSSDYLTEPSPEEILVDLLPRFLNVRVYSGLLETATSEQAARMAAMDNATKACKDMINNLTMVYNKARQAAVTTELMDIVGGAEALKG